MNRKTLDTIDGFYTGATYGECIASEIAISRKITSIGGKIQQVRKEPFYFIRHKDWKQKTPGGPYVHV